MTDKSHLEDFVAEVREDLSKRLLKIFTEGHRDPAIKAVDIVTRLKEQMEQALDENADAST